MVCGCGGGRGCDCGHSRCHGAVVGSAGGVGAVVLVAVHID